MEEEDLAILRANPASGLGLECTRDKNFCMVWRDGIRIIGLKVIESSSEKMLSIKKVLYDLLNNI